MGKKSGLTHPKHHFQPYPEVEPYHLYRHPPLPRRVRRVRTAVSFFLSIFVFVRENLGQGVQSSSEIMPDAPRRRRRPTLGRVRGKRRMYCRALLGQGPEAGSASQEPGAGEVYRADAVGSACDTTGEGCTRTSYRDWFEKKARQGRRTRLAGWKGESGGSTGGFEAQATTSHLQF